MTTTSSAPGAGSSAPEAGSARAATRRPVKLRLRPWTPSAVRTRWSVTGEVAVGFGAATASVLLARGIDVDPLQRVGQVSALAALGLRYALLGLVVLALVVVVSRWAGPVAGALARTLGCAAVPGLVTGFVAGGLTVALRGTTWPLFANSGDSAQLASWAQQLLDGGAAPPDYPPLAVEFLAGWTRVTGGPLDEALKVLQIGGAAWFGPIAYLAWRSLLTPAWSLVMALVAAVPLMDLYKPYANLVLVALLPVVVHLLSGLRGAASASFVRLAVRGAVTGAVIGVLFLTYSGWTVWSAPGVLVAALVVLPWRHGAGRAAVLLGTAVAAFLLVAARHVLGLATAAGSTQDRYFYFDTATEPAYIAMWRNDTPGPTGPWPPPGELGGVGLFSVLLVLGLGAALALGRRRTDVLLLGSCLAGAWLVRLYLASRMYGTGSVQLYPRTTVEILYCLLALTVLAVMLVLGRAEGLLARGHPLTETAGPHVGADPEGRGATGPRARPAVVALIGAALLGGLFMGSATADRWMPRSDGSAGYLAFVSQYVRQADGQCPAWTRPARCLPSASEVDRLLRTG